MRKGSIACVVAVGLMLLTLSGASAATFSYTAQSRKAYAEEYGPYPAQQTITAPNFSNFSATARADELQNGSGPPTGYYSQQTQTSSLMGDSISTSGTWSGQRPPFAGTGNAIGETVTDVTLIVASAVDVDLDATIGLVDTAQGAFTGAHTVSLTGPGTNISWMISAFPGQPNPWTVAARRLPRCSRAVTAFWLTFLPRRGAPLR